MQLALEDFERAEKLLEDKAGDDLNNIPDDYYLLDFKDEELYDVVLKKDEWNEFDYLLAKKLLNERGNPIDEVEEKEMRAERIGQLAQPEKTDGFNRGFLASYAIYTTMKTLPDGRVVHTYSETDRKKAHSRLIIGW